MNDDESFPVMRGERQVRFVFGVIAGSFAGCQLGPRFGTGGETGVLIVVTAIAFGIAAAFLGDAFWRGLRWW
jgi:hypothetical protein